MHWNQSVHKWSFVCINIPILAVHCYIIICLCWHLGRVLYAVIQSIMLPYYTYNWPTSEDANRTDKINWMANPCFFCYCFFFYIYQYNRKLITDNVWSTNYCVYIQSKIEKNLNYNYTCHQCYIIMSKRKLDVACSSSPPN